MGCGNRESQEVLYATIDPLVLVRIAAEWVKRLRSTGLLFAPIQDFKQALADEPARVNAYIVEYGHSRLGTLPLPGSPFSFGRQ